MCIKILTVYNNNVLPGYDLKGDHGVSFHIAVRGEEILFDTGGSGEILLHNLKCLGINPDNISKIVLSHGHLDHTGGLPGFLKARKSLTPVKIIAHPVAMVRKFKQTALEYKDLGFPQLDEEERKKIEFNLTAASVEILPGIFTTGEISIEERTEKQGLSDHLFYESGGRAVKDPFIDDLSLVLKTKTGSVIITGCCHAGLLNTCAKAVKLFGKSISAVIGGTHMLVYSEEEIIRTADILKKTYGLPDLYLNHCTGREAIDFLRGILGKDKVRDFYAGTSLVFESD